jgi:uncharacterized protein (TIGR02266 family)
VGDEDKRRSDREAVTLVVEYEDAEDMLGDYTENLSTGGTFVSTTRELPIDTRVQLSLGFPGLLEPIAIEGTVRWTRGAGDARGAGIEFEPGPGKDQLAAVVERIRARDPRTVSKLVRVLVVEDNVHVCKLIEDGLRGSGKRGSGGVSFVVRSVQDGRQAIEILRREAFDALIIDVYLPVLDGPKVIHQARHELGLADLPIIAVSAGGDSARRSALEAGANIFLDKPMRLRHVLDTIQRLVN